MIELNKLREDLKNKEVFHCVYELYYDNEILYVGSTKKLRSRLASHSAEKKGLFNQVKYTLCSPSEMAFLEAETIFLKNPIMNSTIPTNPKYVPKSQIIKEMKERISDSIESVDNGFLSINDEGCARNYMDIDKMAILLDKIDGVIFDFYGAGTGIEESVDSISTKEVKTDVKYLYNYLGEIDGEVVTDELSSKIMAHKTAYRELVFRNPLKFQHAINNDHRLAVIINKQFKKDYLK